MNSVITNTEFSSLEGTRCQFSGGKAVIKLGIDVHQDFYVVAMQEGGANPKPQQGFHKQAFLHWAAKFISFRRRDGEYNYGYLKSAAHSCVSITLPAAL